MRWFVQLAAFALAACSAHAPVQHSPASTPSTGMCRPVPLSDLPPQTELEGHGAIGARRIWATPGQLACNEPALGAVECEARGSRTLVRIEDGAQTMGFDLRGEEFLRIDQDNVTCGSSASAP